MDSRFLRTMVVAAALLAGGASRAQLLPPVPPVGDVLAPAERTTRDVLDRSGDAVDDARTGARELARQRVRRLSGLVSRFPDRLEMTDAGPAIRGEVIAIEPDSATLAAAAAAGFAELRSEDIEGLDLRTVTLRVPRGWSVERALSRLRRLAPTVEFAANHLHDPAGTVSAVSATATLAQRGNVALSTVGLIDGGVAAHPSLRGAVRQRGFAEGAPRPNAHATAVASLLTGQHHVTGAAPGATLYVADIFGRDPAGGNAAALVRALGWLVQQRVPVVAVSLVGPANRLVARAVEQARARGTWIVAAVGNDGPAAPPAYPASYPGVIAVTGIDGRGRVLVEAGRAAHLDYAAPGADMAAASADGGLVAVRGTSYAVPFVAGRLAHHVGAARPLAALDAEATRGRRGTGRGIVCGGCRTPLPRR